MASLTQSIELAESWQWIVTADGNEEFTLIHYAPWSDVYGPRGDGYRFAELGDVLVTGDGTVDERLRLTRIVASPSQNDKEGCRYEQIYTSNNYTLKGKVPDLRTSWRASFNTTLVVDDVKKQIGSAVGDYSGSAVTNTDPDTGEIIPAMVYVPRTTYNVSYNSSELNLQMLTTKIGKVNSDNFFVAHRKVTSGDQRIKNAEGNVIFQSGTDVNLWLFSNLTVQEIGIGNYETQMEFMFEPAGWNGTDTFYLTTTFTDLFDEVKKMVQPDATVPGRT